MGDKRKSHKKYQRLPVGERPGIKIMPADIEIMRHIFRYRVLESDVLYRLMPHRSEQMISRRLHKLFHNEYIDRPLAQRGANKLTPGSSNIAHTIDNLGAREIQPHLPFDISPSRWKQKNLKLTPYSIDHTLDITRFVAGLAAATHAHKDTRLRYADELIPREFAETRPAGLSNTLRANVEHWPTPGKEEGTAPDAIIAVERGETGHVFLVEVDRGTETIEPGKRQREKIDFWRNTSILRKFLIYAAAFHSRAHTEQFGLEVFRVLTITTTPGRVEEMQACYQRHLADGPDRVPPGLFLFSDWKTLEAADDYLTAPYQRANGKPFSFLTD